MMRGGRRLPGRASSEPSAWLRPFRLDQPTGQLLLRLTVAVGAIAAAHGTHADPLAPGAESFGCHGSVSAVARSGVAAGEPACPGGEVTRRDCAFSGLGGDFDGAGEAGAARLLEGHVQVAERFELVGPGERSGVDGA